jgi:hypothetical protein
MRVITRVSVLVPVHNPRRSPSLVRKLIGLLGIGFCMVVSSAGLIVQAQSLPSSYPFLSHPNPLYPNSLYPNRAMSHGMTGMLTGVPGSGLSPLQIQAVVQASIQVTVNEFDNPLASLDPGSSTRMALVITDSRIPYRIIHPDGSSGSPCNIKGSPITGVASMGNRLTGNQHTENQRTGIQSTSIQRTGYQIEGASTGMPILRSMTAGSAEGSLVRLNSGLLAERTSDNGGLSSPTPAQDHTCLQSLILRREQAIVLLLTAL